MTYEELQSLIRDEAAFKKAFRKTDSDKVRGRELDADGNVISSGPKNEVFELLYGNFVQGRMPFIHQATLPDGSQIRIKFYDTIRKLYSNKNVELIGKESFLSYMEVTVMPVGMKAYYWTMDVNQIVWKDSKSKAAIKHDMCLVSLLRTAKELGIDLSSMNAWATVYTENF